MANNNMPIMITDDEMTEPGNESVITIHSDTVTEMDRDGVDLPMEEPNQDEPVYDSDVPEWVRIEETEERLDRTRPFWREEEYFDSLNADWFCNEDGIEHWKFEGTWLTDYVEGKELHEHLL
jgi:hypothetical protein